MAYERRNTGFTAEQRPNANEGDRRGLRLLAVYAGTVVAIGILVGVVFNAVLV